MGMRKNKEMEVPRGKHARVPDLPKVKAAPEVEDLPEVQPASETAVLPRSEAASAAGDAFAPKHAANLDLPVIGAAAEASDDACEETAFPGLDQVEASEEPTAESAEPAAPAFEVPSKKKKEKKPKKEKAELTPEELEARKAKRRKSAKIAGGTVAGLLVAAYAGGSIFYSSHFLPNTVVGDEDVSGKTTEQVETILQKAADSYELKISGYDFEQTVSQEDMDFKFDTKAVAADMLEKSNGWTWPAALFGSNDVSGCVVATYDADALKTCVSKAVKAHNKDAEPTVDAHVGYDKEAGGVAVIPEKYGKQLRAKAVVAKAGEAAGSLNPDLKLTQDELTQPKIVSTNEKLIAAAEEAKKVATAKVTLTLNGKEAGVIDAESIVKWVTVDTENDFKVAMDEEAMNAWLKDYCGNFNTKGGTRTYTRPDGKKITVTGGDYGWVTNVKSLVKDVEEAVLAGEETTIEIPCKQKAKRFSTDGSKDWGKRYIDVDFSEQHAYMYDKNGDLIWESDIITGSDTAIGGDRATPEGVWDINTKGSPITLFTYNPGSSKPEKTVVQYWMPFVENLIGLHDAWWQPGFGGNMYREGYGSHGCVNLPSSKAQELFGICEVGDVVVTHW